PYSNVHVLFAPFGFTVPFTVAAVSPTPVAAVVATVGAFCEKPAVTVVSADSVTTQVPVPEQPPPVQPVNVDPVVAVAVSVTLVPVLIAVLTQVAPQLMPPTSLLTVPAPVPDLLAVTLNCLSVNVAVAVTSASILTVHGLVVPLHVVFASPVTVQPVNVE